MVMCICHYFTDFVRTYTVMAICYLDCLHKYRNGIENGNVDIRTQERIYLTQYYSLNKNIDYLIVSG